MTSLRRLLFGLMTVGAFAAGTGVASANPGCNSPYCGNKPSKPMYGGVAASAGMPTFQAAPWYLYWPYDAHFQMPAPLTGAFYGPPIGGNFPVNPYFAPAYPGYGGYPGMASPGGYGY